MFRLTLDGRKVELLTMEKSAIGTFFPSLSALHPIICPFFSVTNPFFWFFRCSPYFPYSRVNQKIKLFKNPGTVITFLQTFYFAKKLFSDHKNGTFSFTPSPPPPATLSQKYPLTSRPCPSPLPPPPPLQLNEPVNKQIINSFSPKFKLFLQT